MPASHRQTGPDSRSSDRFSFASRYYQPDTSIRPDLRSIRLEINKQIFEEQDADNGPVGSRRLMEKSMFYYVQTGDIQKVLSFADQSGWNRPVGKKPVTDQEIKVGELSEQPLQQMLGLFISNVTLCTRAALDGGLPEHIAYSISDCYIRHAIRLTDVKRIQHLNLAAMHDFTCAVHDYLYRDCTPATRQCCEYIMSHMHDPITLTTLSQVCRRSPHYISDSFAKELGMRPMAFIRMKKLEYARAILQSTDLSVTTVSDLLAFPSPSAFITYFRKQYGRTPQQYRLQP
ncbi:MAG: helix-turn-helix transcriptional regulator [Lachnospiraceae bacterium]|nr:helix-turn-helix transcriptional regulator [Lachnospiraceae bacterium]